MLDRASSFAERDVVRMLSRHYVPVALDEWYAVRRQDEAGELYRKIVYQREGMRPGRTTQGLYLAEPDGALVVGWNNRDPGKLESNRAAGRRVVYADAEDASFWSLLNIDRLRVILLAVPDVNAKVIAARSLRRRGFHGLLSATYVYPEEEQPILDAGCDVTYNYFTEAGVGLARDTEEAMRPPTA